MDLSTFVTYDKKESLLLSIAKFNQEIVENTHSKQQETLEFKMTKQKESFSFDVPLELPEKWMMGVTSLEVYHTVYNITNNNNKLEIVLNDQQLKELNLDSELLVFVEDLYKSYFGKPYKYNEFIEKVNKLVTNSYSKKKKLTRVDFTYLTKIIESPNQIYKDRIYQEKIKQENINQEKEKQERIIQAYKDHLKHAKINWKEIKWEKIILEETTHENQEDEVNQINQINLPPFEIIENDFFGIQLTPGVYELVDINNAFEQKINESDYDFKIDIQADTISMKSVLTTSNPIHFNSRLYILLGFTNKDYQAGTHTSKPVMITTTDKVNLKCDCVDGLIVNGIREQMLFSFNLSTPPGYKVLKEPTTVLYKKINKTSLGTIQFFLEDSNHDRVHFNGETLIFTNQIIKF